VTEQSLAALQLVATALLNAGLAATVGALASAAWLRQGTSPWAMRAGPVLRQTLQAALVATLLASLGALWLQAAVMADVPLREALPAVGSVLSQSHYGAAWRIGAAGLGVALIAAGWPPRAAPRPCSALVAAGVVAFAYSRSLLGHAGAHGDATWGVGVDMVHLLLVSLWAGEVFVGAFVLSAACDAGDRQERARWVETLSSSAAWALAGIVATGVLNAWRTSGGAIGPLVGSGYGIALLVKLVLVGIAVALGGVNRLLVMPQLLPALRGGGSMPVERLLRRFLNTLRVETVVLAAVLLLAAVLSASPPPGSP
jgi:putative copper resistance protein D